MIIPKDAEEREFFYRDLIRKCLVSRETRRADYSALKSYYLFGSAPEESPAQYNKIFPHIDQLVSFLYAAETTRFSIVLGAGVNVSEHKKSPKLVQRLNDEWYSSNADLVFGEAISWAMCYNSTFVKLIWKSGKVHPYMVEPSMMGVLREDVPYLDDQEAFVNTYYITKSDLWSRLYNHPNRDSILNRITASIKAREDIPEGVSRIVITSGPKAGLELPLGTDALTIGRRIRQLRSARGMTLEELATAVERAPSQLSMIETGKRFVSAAQAATCSHVELKTVM